MFHARNMTRTFESGQAPFARLARRGAPGHLSCMARAKREKRKIGTAGGVIGLVLLGAVGSCIVIKRSRDDAAFDRCRAEGQRYYRAIGSYPTLSDGEQTEPEIIRRCKSYPEAFDGLDVR